MPEINVELLETEHSFPCRFTFKVIGNNTEQFAATVVAAIQSMDPDDVVPAHSTRTTAGERHICVTVEPDVQSAQHVAKIYEVLRSLEGVVLLL